MGVLVKDADTIHFVMGSIAEIVLYEARDDTMMRGKKYVLPIDKESAQGLIERLQAALTQMGGIQVADPAQAVVEQARAKHQPKRRRK